MPEITCLTCNGTGEAEGTDPQLALYDLHCRTCRGEGKVRTLWGRERVLQAYLETGNGDFTWAPDYAESGSKLEEGQKGVLLGNWNSEHERQCHACKALEHALIASGEPWDQCAANVAPDGSLGHHDWYYDGPEDRTRPRLGAIAQRAGYETEWRDEWSTCEDCQKAFRTEGNGHGWRPSYVWLGDSAMLCLKCVDPDEYLASYVGTTERMKAAIDLSECGYGLVGFSLEHLQSDPAKILLATKKIAEALKGIGITDFLFTGEDAEPSVYVRGREILRGTYLEAEELRWAVQRAEQALEEAAKQESERVWNQILQGAAA